MIRIGEIVWIVAGQDWKRRPAIVIKVSKDGQRAIVLSGTGTGPRDIPHHCVNPALRLYKPLRLTKPTYFYQTNVHVCAIGDLTIDREPARCPLPIWESIRELALAGCREKLSQNDFSTWWPPGPDTDTAGDEGVIPAD